MGKSLGGSRGPKSTGVGLETERFSGENDVIGKVSLAEAGHKSDVLGVVKTGVVKTSSLICPCDLACGGLRVRVGMVGNPRGESNPEAESGGNFGVVSISSDDVDDLALGEDDAEAPRFRPVILAEVVVNIVSMVKMKCYVVN